MSITSKVAALVAAAAFVLAAGAAHAQSLTGSWRGVAMGVLFQLTVQPDRAYIESQSNGTLMTQQSGTIQAAGPGMIGFTVVDWQPKTMPQYHPTGTVGGYYTQVPTSRPPGGVWRLQFNGPNAFTLTDVRLGGSITFTRVG
jgi:hypothetical protein